ncbi:hypothetical protein ACFS2C_21965 [Prauserella oleivorans]|uniref:TrbL/VirB6 plasmid conjugal transfer protein n=1 Tax=Prauserella oleivorans TaxID=1478153 RepID=A0ABW5WI55_9PSEU
MGEDCIPQPTTAAPDSPDTRQNGPAAGADAPDCGITNISGCLARAVHNVFADIVESAISPILDLLGYAALTTPTLDQLPGVGALWNNSWQIILASYILFVLVGGIVVMTHETLQTRYSIKEIAPRLVVAFVASALSLFAADKMIRLANALSRAVLGDDINPPSLGENLREAVGSALTGGLFLLILAIVLVVIGLGLLLVYAVRVVITLLLLIAAPLFLACHALPHTDGIARWWWRAFSLTLTIQIAQSLVLITATRTFLSGGIQSGKTELFSTSSALGMIIAALALFYILFKIPFWALRAAQFGNGRSLLGGLAKTYLFAKTLGFLGGKSGLGKSATATTAAAPSLASGSASAADPPWPRQPRIAAIPHALHRRLLQQRDAERLRVARKPRTPPAQPRFVQPVPQDPPRESAAGHATRKAAMPEFSSARSTLPAPPAGAASTPPTPPQFRAPGASSRDPQPPRPIRTAAVPTHLRFQSPRPAPPSASRPHRASSPPLAARFRPPTPEPPFPGSHVRPSAPAPVRFHPPPPPQPSQPDRGGDRP